MVTRIHTDPAARAVFEMFEAALRDAIERTASGWGIDRIGIIRADSFDHDIQEVEIRIHLRPKKQIGPKQPWDMEPRRYKQGGGQVVQPLSAQEGGGGRLVEEDRPQSPLVLR